MKLVSNWKRIMRKAWSIRLMLAAGLLSGVEAVLPLFVDSLPRGVFAGLSITIITGAMVARVTAQKGVDDDAQV
jgi:hypothetical protein